MSDASLYLKPWIRYDDVSTQTYANIFSDDELIRHSMTTDNVIVQIYTERTDLVMENFDGWKCVFFIPGASRSVELIGPFTTVEIAMEECDKRLVELGYILLTQEQMNKIELLI